jgi:predicted transcriptional regulator
MSGKNEIVINNDKALTIIEDEKKKLVDVETGEVIIVDNVQKHIYGPKAFWKIYLLDFMTVLGIIDSKQLDVCIYIAENTSQSNNLFIGTHKRIAADVGVSPRTVNTILNKLKDNGSIKRVQNGVWAVNPNIMMKDNDRKRQILLSYYETSMEQEERKERE